MNTLAGIYSFHVGWSTSIDGGPNDVDFSSILLTGTGIIDPISIPQNFSSTMDNDLIENFDLAGLNLGVGTYTLTIQGSTDQWLVRRQRFLRAGSGPGTVDLGDDAGRLRRHRLRDAPASQRSGSRDDLVRSRSRKVGRGANAPRPFFVSR
jgi:hypothetical protein